MHGLRALRIPVLVLWVGASLVVFSLWLLQGRNLGSFPRADLPSMVYGGAHRPFSARLLLPWTARALVAPLPDDLGEGMAAGSATLTRLAERFDVPPRFLPELLVLIALDYLALLGFTLALASLLDALYRPPDAARALAPVAALAVLPLFFAQGTHFLYDLPALLAFTLGLDAIRRRRSTLLLCVLGVGVLNKETIVFLIPVLLLYEWDRAPRRALLRQAGLALAITAVSRGLAIVLSNPAEALGRNDYLRDFLLANVMAAWNSGLLQDYGRVAALIVFGILIGRDFGRQPLLLRRGLLAASPLVLLMLYGGRWGEIRAVYELFPILFLLGFQTLVALVATPMPVHDESDEASMPTLPQALAGPVVLAGGIALLGVAWIAFRTALG